MGISQYSAAPLRRFEWTLPRRLNASPCRRRRVDPNFDCATYLEPGARNHAGTACYLAPCGDAERRSRTADAALSSKHCDITCGQNALSMRTSGSRQDNPACDWAKQEPMSFATRVGASGSLHLGGFRPA